MTTPLNQHPIDPEIGIRCSTCGMTCPIGAIQNDDITVVVDPDSSFFMGCSPVCPTGSIDEWRVVETPYPLEQQHAFDELPEQGDIALPEGGDGDSIEAHDDVIAAPLAEAHKGAGGKAKAPASASKPTINLYSLSNPATARVQGNDRLTDAEGEHDARHIILDLGNVPFPVLEGQSLGIIPPGVDAEGIAHLPRLYSVSSPRHPRSALLRPAEEGPGRVHSQGVRRQPGHG